MPKREKSNVGTELPGPESKKLIEREKKAITPAHYHYLPIAIESAGVTLVKGDLLGIARARRLSQATMTNIRQNLFFAFIYNAAGVPIAAGVLYPVAGLLLSPIIAAAAMALSSVSVVGNALRLRAAKL